MVHELRSHYAEGVSEIMDPSAPDGCSLNARMGGIGVQRRARTLQKLSILREAAHAGYRLVDVLDIATHDEVSSSVRATFAPLFSGSLRQNAVQVYRFEIGGREHVYAQPFDGAYPAPGEHHCALPGCLEFPLILIEGFARPRWKTYLRATVPRAFDEDAGLWSVLEGIRWDWRLGLGRFAAPWLLQLRPVAAVGTRFAMFATGETRVSTHQVGLQEARDIYQQLARLLLVGSPERSEPFLQPAPFSKAFDPARTTPFRPSVPPPQTPPRDFADAIQTALSPHVNRKLLLQPIPENKEQNARRYVLPPSCQDQPIIALIDLTLMGSAKDAVVFTSTHCFLREGDEHLCFAWPEVRGVVPPDDLEDDHITIVLSRVGEVALPSARRAGALHPLFQYFARLP